jgi:hypothetical protein
VDKTTPAADGVEVTTVYVTVEQDRLAPDGEALPVANYAASNVTVTATPSTGVTITQPTGTANENGTVTATFVSTNPAQISIGATAFGRTLAGSVTVDVGGSITPPAEGEPFYTQPTTEGNVFASDNGFTWNSRGSRVSEQVVPAGRTGYGVRFRFGPDAAGADSNAEQRFALGRDLDEIWMEYDLWVPANFAHRNESPSNNKFFRLWGNDYTARNKIGASTWYSASFDENASLRGDYIRRGSSSITASGSPVVEFCPTADLGTWRQVRIHAKYVTADGAADGLIELWFDGVKVFEWANLDQRYEAAEPYWNAGYLFGAANSGYAAETDFYTYALKLYETDPGWT